MSEGWATRDFEDCLQPVRYTRKIQRAEFATSGVFPIISQEADFINGYWNNAADVFRVDKPLVVFGDHTQIAKYIDFDFVLGADGVKLLVPIEELDSKFFYYFLLAHPIKTIGYARHYRLLKELKVAYPEMVEQRRIVTILDEVFEGIGLAMANAEKNLTNSRAIFESYVSSLFLHPHVGWAQSKLGDVCEIIVGQSPPGSSYNTDGIGVPLINGPDEFGGTDAFSKTVATKFTVAPTKMCRKGDLIL